MTNAILLMFFYLDFSKALDKVPHKRLVEKVKAHMGLEVISYMEMDRGLVKGALYRIQIPCRRHTFWSYSAGLTIADPPG